MGEHLGKSCGTGNQSEKTAVLILLLEETSIPTRFLKTEKARTMFSIFHATRIFARILKQQRFIHRSYFRLFDNAYIDSQVSNCYGIGD